MYFSTEAHSRTNQGIFIHIFIFIFILYSLNPNRHILLDRFLFFFFNSYTSLYFRIQIERWSWTNQKMKNTWKLKTFYSFFLSFFSRITFRDTEEHSELRKISCGFILNFEIVSFLMRCYSLKLACISHSLNFISSSINMTSNYYFLRDFFFSLGDCLFFAYIFLWLNMNAYANSMVDALCKKTSDWQWSLLLIVHSTQQLLQFCMHKIFDQYGIFFCNLIFEQIQLKSFCNQSRFNPNSWYHQIFWNKKKFNRVRLCWNHGSLA